MELRDFLYLDRALVRDFLAQLEGGAVDEATERDTSSGKGGLNARIGVSGTGIGAERSNEHSLTTEAVVRQVAASEFDRLYRHLEDESLQVVEEVGHPDDVAFRRKQFLEIDGRVSAGGLGQLSSLVTMLASAAPALQQVGAELPAEMAGLQALTSLDASTEKVPLVVRVPGAADFRVAIEIDPAQVRVGQWDVDATVLLKVQRVLRPGETHLLGNPLGGLLKLLPEQSRDELTAALRTPEAAQLGIGGDLQIEAPGLVGTPVAIYR
jgi:hypothetical protein